MLYRYRWARKARFKVRVALGLVRERHRVHVIGLWQGPDGGIWGSGDALGQTDLTLVYFVDCDWCGRIGEHQDAMEALRLAFAHSPYVERGTFHRSRLSASHFQSEAHPK
jgi:hypothetical protein